MVVPLLCKHATNYQPQYSVLFSPQRAVAQGEKWRTYSILLRYGAYSNRTTLVALQLHSKPEQNNHGDDAVDHHRKFR